jgi:hypothetical protein
MAWWWNDDHCLNVDLTKRIKKMIINKNTQRQFLTKAAALKDALKKRPVFVAGFIGVILILFVVSGGQKKKRPHLTTSTIPFEEDIQMTGVKESIDPRDVWTAKVEQKVEMSSEEFNKKLEEIKETQNIEVIKVQEELLQLKGLVTRQQEIWQKPTLRKSIKLLAEKPQQRRLVRFPRNMGQKRRISKII